MRRDDGGWQPTPLPDIRPSGEDRHSSPDLAALGLIAQIISWIAVVTKEAPIRVLDVWSNQTGRTTTRAMSG